MRHSLAGTLALTLGLAAPALAADTAEQALAAGLEKRRAGDLAGATAEFWRACLDINQGCAALLAIAREARTRPFYVVQALEILCLRGEARACDSLPGAKAAAGPFTEAQQQESEALLDTIREEMRLAAEVAALEDDLAAVGDKQRAAEEAADAARAERDRLRAEREALERQVAEEEQLLALLDANVQALELHAAGRSDELRPRAAATCPLPRIGAVLPLAERYAARQGIAAGDLVGDIANGCYLAGLSFVLGADTDPAAALPYLVQGCELGRAPACRAGLDLVAGPAAAVADVPAALRLAQAAAALPPGRFAAGAATATAAHLGSVAFEAYAGGQAEVALDLAAAAVRLDAAAPDARFTRAQILLRQRGDAAAALRDLDEIIGRDLGRAGTFMLRGEALVALGRPRPIATSTAPWGSIPATPGRGSCGRVRRWRWPVTRCRATTTRR